KVEEILPKMYFSVSIGTNYFMEIAKLRALRFLWRRIANQWTQEVPYTPIHAFTSTFYDAALTPNTNMLRATTEAMSAVVGGGDLLSVHAYDFVFQTPDDFSERIARNISLLLKEESYLGKTSDPAAGSYYIENLTAQLVEKAWGLFLEVESKGGVMAAFEQNFIQEQIENTFQKRLAALQSNERIMVGVNKFQFDQATIAKDAPSNEAALLNPRRLAAIFEK
ncbi:MAG: methylmalonyl-CoA mutase family protein, partial [Runella sp.]